MYASRLSAAQRLFAWALHGLDGTRESSRCPTSSHICSGFSTSSRRSADYPPDRRRIDLCGRPAESARWWPTTITRTWPRPSLCVRNSSSALSCDNPLAGCHPVTRGRRLQPRRARRFPGTTPGRHRRYQSAGELNRNRVSAGLRIDARIHRGARGHALEAIGLTHRTGQRGRFQLSN